jgi:hypothetical protein
MMTRKHRKYQKTGATFLALAAIFVAAAGTPAMAATGSTVAPGSISSTSPGNCNNAVQSAINQAANNIENQAEQTYSAVPAPANLASSTCFSNILNMGSSIGLSFFNPATLIKQLEQMVCNAAQQALQWPMQQASNAINQYGQLPYGMGGITMTPGGSGLSVNTSTAPGPGTGSIPGVNSASNLLGNALGN